MFVDGCLGSDLACECVDERSRGLAGVCFDASETDGIEIEKMNVGSFEASAKIGKPMGNYVTVHCGRLDRMSETDYERTRRALTKEIGDMTSRLCSKRPRAELGVLVAGLGNAELTADAIGPMTASALTATRQLRMFEKSLFDSLGCASLSVITPGVLGETGIESAEILCGTVTEVRPDVMIVVDALAARSCERLASTVQLSDCGIAPGSGVGNHRRAIDRHTMGIPVIAIGIPTVVGSATLVYDALKSAGIEHPNERLKSVLETGKSFFVSPKECDLICKRGAALLADAITDAFCGSIFQELRA